MTALFSISSTLFSYFPFSVEENLVPPTKKSQEEGNGDLEH